MRQKPTDSHREALARKKAEIARVAERISDLFSDLDTSFAVIKVQIAAMTERHTALTAEATALERLATAERVDPDIEDEFYARLASLDPTVVRAARTELMMITAEK